MFDRIPPQYKAMAEAVLGMLAIAAIFYMGWTVNGWRLESQMADLKIAHANEVTAAVVEEMKRGDAIRDAEKAAREGIEGVANAERERAAAAADTVRRLGAESAGLRAQLAKYSAAKACGPSADPATAGRGIAAAAAGVVSGDVRDELLWEAAEVLRQLAPAIDDSTGHNVTCRDAYEVARKKLEGLAK